MPLRSSGSTIGCVASTVAELFRVLIVVDDQPLTRVVAFALSHGAYKIRIERTLASASAAIGAMRPHLAIIDFGADGGRVLELIRDEDGQRRLPIIALSYREDLDQNLAILERGADDLLTVPFVPAELMTRVRALIRRTCGERVHFVPVIRIGDLSIDILNRRVRRGSTEIRLTALEQALLYLLAANSGTIVSRELIMDALWGANFVTETNVIERHIRSLRLKLQDDVQRPKYIHTVRGQGYRFVAQRA